ncbi:MAG: HTTM domain-containing protein, partial [Myroides sp.]
IFKYFFVPYLIIQILLPIRHWFIKGDVLWTEEAHRLSWRMMLRSRTGETHFKVIDKKTNERLTFNNTELLNEKQRSRLNAPDVIWQMAHKIKDHFKSQGKDVAVYAMRSSVSINMRPSSRLIDPKVDLASEEWSHFKHHDWVLEEKDPKDQPVKKNSIQNLKKLKFQK